MQAQESRLNMCFAPLDAHTQNTPNTIEILAVVDGGFEYPADLLDRALDRYCIEGGIANAEDLAEAPDDCEFVEVVCRVRRPVAGSIVVNSNAA
jgi:hypothetical protein